MLQSMTVNLFTCQMMLIQDIVNIYFEKFSRFVLAEVDVSEHGMGPFNYYFNSDKNEKNY